MANEMRNKILMQFILMLSSLFKFNAIIFNFFNIE